MEANLLIAALSGFIGAVILTLLIYVLKVSGQSLDIPYLIGTRFVDIKNQSRVYTVGIALHLLFGAGWGILYVFLLTAMVVTPNWPAGILWGLGHGIFVGSMMGILADTHPAIGEGKPISDPGIMGSSWGTLIPYYVLGLHIIYGACTLAIYHQFMAG
ncbi:hypothetical protein [Fodinibius salsisoli]|uniref:Uncharacterized protein n=1 Tax=Fodinibius salsisoli TaxID=2820877 RepID=A0ABT3PS10_9BACT|nr:hypothetical protein [Fodinibius salsisoli]MCW9708636.1 hypothetical protein [Fodinibius salsisoli]